MRKSIKDDETRFWPTAGHALAASSRQSQPVPSFVSQPPLSSFSCTLPIPCGCNEQRTQRTQRTQRNRRKAKMDKKRCKEMGRDVKRWKEMEREKERREETRRVRSHFVFNPSRAAVGIRQRLKADLMMWPCPLISRLCNKSANKVQPHFRMNMTLSCLLFLLVGIFLRNMAKHQHIHGAHQPTRPTRLPTADFKFSMEMNR